MSLQICKTLHRQPKHLLDFLLAELGTSGSVDGNSQLIIKGRFQQKQIENVLRRYIKEYVTCHTCRSPDTILQKDTRLFFLQCEMCGSRCSVASIKSGFQVNSNWKIQTQGKGTYIDSLFNHYRPLLENVLLYEPKPPKKLSVHLFSIKIQKIIIKLLYTGFLCMYFITVIIIIPSQYNVRTNFYHLH